MAANPLIARLGLSVTPAGSALALAAAFGGMALDAANRIGVYTDVTAAAEVFGFVAGGLTQARMSVVSGVADFDALGTARTRASLSVGDNDASAYLGIGRFGVGQPARIQAGYGADGVQNDTGLVLAVRTAGGSDLDVISMSSAGAITFLTPPVLGSLAPNSIVTTNGSSALTSVALTDGQLLVGSTGVAPVAATLTAGANIIITPGAGTLQISASGGATPGGADTQVQYNNGGVFDADAAFTFDNGTGFVSSTGHLLGAGTALLPALSFTADTNTGLYSSAANELGVTTDGTLRFTFSSVAVTSTVIGIFPATSTSNASIRLPHGTAPTTPVNGDVWTTTAGMFARVNGSTVGPFGTGGSGTPGGATTQVQYNNAGAFAGNAAFTFNSGTGVVSSTGYLLGAGSAASPALSFTADPDTGIYNSAANEVAVSAGGTLRLTVSASALTSTVPGIFPATTTSAPSIRLPHGTAPTTPTNGDMWTTTAGVFARVNGSTVGPFGAGGATPGGATTQVQFNNAGAFDGSANFVWTGTQLQLLAGTLGAPSYSFSGDLTTGFYRPTASEVSVVLGGVQICNFSPSIITNYTLTAFPASTTSAASIRLPHGTAPTTPTNGDMWTTTAGVFARVNGSTVGPFGAGGGTPAGSNTQIQFNNSGVFGGSANLVWTGTQFQTAAGSAASPSITFVGDPDTGIYNGATNEITFATNGAARMYLDTTVLGLTGGVSFFSAGYVQWTTQARSPVGSLGAPSYSFVGDLTTGLYHPTGSEVSVVLGGVQICNFSPSIITNYTLTAFPATTSGAASIRLPHGTAPSSPVNGDMWTTTAGVFARVNGSTVGPFGVGGGTPAGSDTQVQYNNAGSFGAASTFTFASGALSVSSNVDTTHTFGTSQVGYDGTNADLACFAHLDQMATAPAVSQTASGYTSVTGAAGQQVVLAIAGVGGIVAATADAFRCNFPIVMNFQRIFMGNSTTLASSTQIIRGSGDPNGSYVAPPGSIYLNTTGGAGVSFYVKESGTSDTGWVAK